jgi:suppressor for copper-sensitivity B
MKMKLKFIAVILLTILIPLSSYAGVSDWQKSSVDEEGKIRLKIAGFGEGKNSIIGALEIELKDSWKTYWKTPGDAGLPLSIDFAKSKNIKDIKILWPSPTRYDFYGIETWGYKHHAVFPIQIEPINKSEAVELNISISWAVCDENCIFLRNEFSEKITQDYSDKNVFDEVAKAIEKTQKNNGENGLFIENFSQKENNHLEIKVSSSDEIDTNKADIFILESEGNFKFLKPVFEVSEDKKSAVAKIKYDTLLEGKTAEGKNLRITFVSGDYSVETSIIAPKPNEILSLKAENKTAPIAVFENKNIENTKPKISENILFFAMLAFLGGLILNIMPCVLPVLLLKIFGALKYSGKSHSHIRVGFLFSTLGIISSFLLLASLVVLLKYLGASVGWGIQFQNAYFIIFLSLILALFTANQWGFFEINLSGDVSQKLSSVDDSSFKGSFLTGAFATLLATPCSAPFLGTAISFALTSSNIELFLIFFAMGVGLATPYILVSIFPRIVNIFPKPGSWMIKIKYLLGAFLFATLVWLLWVLASIIGYFGAIPVYILISALLGVLYWSKANNTPSIRVILFVVYISAMAFIIPQFLVGDKFTPQDEAKSKWQHFDQAKLAEYIGQDKLIFVDITADWCLTCKFNKINVINSAEIENLFEKNQVIRIKADYTKPSAEINNYLKSFDKYAIPVNIVYGKNAKKGIVLPVVLTKENVTQAINQAKGE